MAVFYVLPPRPLVGDRFAAFLGQLFPGLDWDAEARQNLAHALADAAECQPDVYVLFRDDLPDAAPAGEALCDGFGAVPGDEVVEVRPGAAPPRRWRIEREAA